MERKNKERVGGQNIKGKDGKDKTWRDEVNGRCKKRERKGGTKH